MAIRVSLYMYEIFNLILILVIIVFNFNII